LLPSADARRGFILHPAPPLASFADVPAADAILERGTAIGRFVVMGLLGKGGMGEVYAAHDPELDRQVAIKLLHAGTANESPGGRLRLMREAQAIARVSHPSVVVVYDVGTFRQRVFIAMELVAGHTLRYWTLERARSWPELLEVFVSAGRGLAAAHERELVHRDFKPDNVMIAFDGQVRVMDFGLVQLSGERSTVTDAVPAAVHPVRPTGPARDDQDLQSTQPVAVTRASRPASGPLSVELTRTGTAVGTPAYMSPEQFRNEPTDARTDQFSFCVALYEAIYGERPFAGASVHELSDEVCAGRVREAPLSSQVPGWLREVLLRGLRRGAGERWPSMNALLAELEKQPAVASRRRFVAAAGTKLAGIWEAPRGEQSLETAAKAEMREAFLSTGKAYAARAWEGTSQLLDRYARRWSDLYVEACEATHVRGEQSAEVLDLRMACLREGLQDLQALIGMFRRPTVAVVENAVGAAAALGNLERCENLELLRAVLRPPEDPAARREVERLRGQLAEVRAFCRVGRPKDGAAVAIELERAARALGYGPLLADVLIAICRLPEEQGAMDEAGRLSEEAMLTAIACRHEEAAAEAAVLLVGHAATHKARLEAAEAWSRIAEALLRRIGGHDLLWGWLLTGRSELRTKQGRLVEALEDARQSLGAKERALGPDQPDLGISLNNVAVILDELGQLDEAVEHGRRAVELVERGFGPDHPRTALLLSNYSEYLVRCGRCDEAVEAAERALAVFEREADLEGVFVFVCLIALGNAHLAAGRVVVALPILERAERIGDTGAPTLAYRALARFTLARALQQAGSDSARALSLAQTAEREYRTSPAIPITERNLAAIATWLQTHDPAGGQQPR
jgi:eukaryotic-like serine/threonine-protein kinase